MSAITVTVEALSKAVPGPIFCLLCDGSTWPDWSLFDRFELERPGRDGDQGVGAIRVFSTRISRAREEVVEIVADRRLSYILLSGLPLDDYRADVDLLSGPEGATVIRWQCRFRARHPALGWFWRWFMQQTLRRLSRQLADAARDPAIAGWSSGSVPSNGTG